jgi:hypothetical protein
VGALLVRALFDCRAAGADRHSSCWFCFSGEGGSLALVWPGC